MGLVRPKYAKWQKYSKISLHLMKKIMLPYFFSNYLKKIKPVHQKNHAG